MEACAGGYYCVCVYVCGNPPRLHILSRKKKKRIQIFFPPLPQVLSVLYRGTGAEPPPPFPAYLIAAMPVSQLMWKGGKLSGLHSPPGESLTGSF